MSSKRGPKNIKNGSRRDRLLRELVDELDLLMTVGYRPAKVLKYGMEGVRHMRAAADRRNRRNAMAALKRRNLLDVERIGEEYRVSLTKLGAEAYWQNCMLAADELPENETCFVIFDIPESKRTIRTDLRKLLVQNGFAQLQKSVWICRFDVIRPLQELLHVRGNEYWVRIFIASELRRTGS